MPMADHDKQGGRSRSLNKTYVKSQRKASKSPTGRTAQNRTYTVQAARPGTQAVQNRTYTVQATRRATKRTAKTMPLQDIQEHDGRTRIIRGRNTAKRQRMASKSPSRQMQPDGCPAPARKSARGGPAARRARKNPKPARMRENYYLAYLKKICAM